MKKEDFIHNFALQFDETEESAFVFETRFRDLDEWSSLNALAILNMIEKKYGVLLKADDIKNINTIEELFDLVKSKS
jgi:acyl carrier protein